ncbi:MAG: hypothetical protein HKN18_01080 [Silicimonas sp.]|nr:hypothetical protein [Silicimonas sp.]
MELSSFALIAEIVAAVAVIVSLLFVGYEVHQTRKQSELSNWRDVLQGMIDYKAATNDIGFADLISRGHADYDSLSAPEKLSFGLYLEQGIHVFGNFIKHNDSLPQKLQGLESAIGQSFCDLLTTPGGAAWWEDAQARGRFMPDTYQTTNRLIRETGSVATALD